MGRRYFWIWWNETFMKSCNEERDEGYFLEVDIQYLEYLQNLHNDLPILPERIKMWKACSKFTWQNWTCYLHKKFKASFEP